MTETNQARFYGLSAPFPANVAGFHLYIKLEPPEEIATLEEVSPVCQAAVNALGHVPSTRNLLHTKEACTNKNAAVSGGKRRSRYEKVPYAVIGTDAVVSPEKLSSEAG